MDAAVFSAAIAQAEQDELWREAPPLEDGCEHDLELLPVVQFRVSVVCRNCGGLAAELARQMMRDPLRFRFGKDGTIRDGGAIVARYGQAVREQAASPEQRIGSGHDLRPH
jgi:hypothetical protein